MALRKPRTGKPGSFNGRYVIARTANVSGDRYFLIYKEEKSAGTPPSIDGSSEKQWA